MHKRVQQGLFTPLSDDEEAELYNRYCQMIKDAGFEHYEISNFAKPGYQSQHNTAYWEQKPYLGFGAAAHSYNGLDCRRWNIANIKSYSQAWANSTSNTESGYEQEFLEDSDLYNELIMTRLRTSSGIPLNILTSPKFNKFWESNQHSLQKYIAKGVAKIKNNHLILTEEGWLISDAIFTDLFY